ncbi:E3 ubiquitin-protein ligase CCNB1IP1-like isoform X2 [Periplaneta americana]
MVLCGLRPEIIIDITNRALTFWQYQMCQELQYQKALVKKTNDNFNVAEEEYENQIMKLKTELQVSRRNQEDLQQEVSNQVQRLGELQNRLLEKNRQLQNLLALNNKLRCSTTNPQLDGSPHAHQSLRNKYTLGPQTIGDVIPNQEDNLSVQGFAFTPVLPH